MSSFGNYKKKPAIAVMTEENQTLTAQLVAALAYNEQAVKDRLLQDEIVMTHASQHNLFLDIVKECGGMGKADRNVANNVIKWAATLTSPSIGFNFIRPWPEIQSIQDAYQYTTVSYLKKCLQQIHDTAQDNTATAKQPKTHNQKIIDGLKTNFADHGFTVVDLLSSPPSTKTATQLKEDCSRFISALDQLIEQRYSGFIGKPTEQLNVQISPRIVDFVFNNNNQAPTALAPSGMK